MTGFPKTFRITLSDGTSVYLLIKKYSINGVPTYFWCTDVFSTLGTDEMESELYINYLECLIAMYEWIVSNYKDFQVYPL